MTPALEKSTLEEERVEQSKGDTLGYEGPDRKKPWNEKPRPEKPGIEKPGHQEPCERPPEKPPDQPRAKIEEHWDEVRRKSGSSRSL